MKVLIQRLKSFYLFLFPQMCVSCNKYNELFCSDCESKLQIYEPTKCFLCEKNSKVNIHNKCKKKSKIDELIITFDKNKYSQNLIYDLKFNHNQLLAKTIADLIYLTLDNKFDEDFIITSVPLHTTKNNIRGYNQSELIARNLSENLNLSYINLLKRIKVGKDQKFKTRLERKSTLSNVFITNKTDLEIKNIIIIDDIITTGSTLFECAKVLKRKYRDSKIIAIAFQHG